MYIDRINVNGGETNPIIGIGMDTHYPGIDLTEKFADEIAALRYALDLKLGREGGHAQNGTL